MEIKEFKALLSSAQEKGLTLEESVEMANALDALEKESESLKMAHAKLKKDYFDLAMKVGTSEDKAGEDIGGDPKEISFAECLAKIKERGD